MGDDPPGNVKWNQVTSALGEFFEAPESTGIGAGLQYFGLTPGGDTPCNTDDDCPASKPTCYHGFCWVVQSSCDVADYEKLDQDVKPLPGAAAGLVASMSRHAPSSGTPTGPALQGAIHNATEWLSSHPDHVVIVVVATDGVPETCSPMDTATIASTIVAPAAHATPPIKTFVIGVGGALNDLNAIATAGGSVHAYLVDTGQKDAFRQALDEIRGRSLPCRYAFPERDAGKVDPALVNMHFTPSHAAFYSTIPQVKSAAACTADQPAWYYDEPAHPSELIACDSACALFKADLGGRVDIAVGCATERVRIE